MNTTPHSGRLHNHGRAGRMRNHRRPSRSGQRGYTLNEVIVAFALLAVGLGILLAILSGGGGQGAGAGEATRGAREAGGIWGGGEPAEGGLRAFLVYVPTRERLDRAGIHHEQRRMDDRSGIHQCGR